MDKRYELIVIIGLLLLAAYAVLITVYNNEGIGWDFLDNYLNAKTLLNRQFYTMTLPLNIVINVSQNGSNTPYLLFQFIAQNGIYLALARPPVAPLFIAAAMLIDNNVSIQIYILMLLLLMAITILFVSKKMNLNPIILSGLMFSFFVVRWTVMYNSEEILSISAAFLFIGLIAERNKLTGISAAVVGLAKYTNLVLLPMLLLLGNIKKIALALALLIIFTLPFIIYMDLYFGLSLLSYQISFHEASLNPVSTENFFSLISQILAYPTLILVIVLLFGFFKYGRKMLNLLNPKLDYRYAVAFSFLIISIIGYAIEYQHVGVPMRFGYLLYASLALLTSLVVSSIGDTKIRLFKGHDLNFVLQSGIFFTSLCILTILYLQVSSGSYGLWLGPTRTKNPDILQAVQKLHNSNLSNCMIVSNIWPFMNFYNITAYSSDTHCNSTEERLPILVSTFGINTYCGYETEFENKTQIPYNFSLVIPSNYLCIKNK